MGGKGGRNRPIKFRTTTSNRWLEERRVGRKKAKHESSLVETPNLAKTVLAKTLHFKNTEKRMSIRPTGQEADRRPDGSHGLEQPTAAEQQLWLLSSPAAV